eukprot:TRINITY_DN30238_c0_g1_i1.p1 TRINITY_DN30238_c0_g1~~TRINITY_DN30238_c0_g1_i1.p1  ORF type:complete len:184 (-),score=36.05 TRINITY_DN30238_c0_g1_i1:27-578(-)
MCIRDSVSRREGYCYKVNTNTAQSITRRTFRVVVAAALWIGVYSVSYVVIIASTGEQPDSWNDITAEPSESTEEFVLLHVASLACAVIAVVLWLLGPHLCPKVFRVLPASKVYRVWLTLAAGDLSYYYKHSHRGDGHAPEEGILLLLPGTRVVLDEGHGNHNCLTKPVSYTHLTLPTKRIVEI